MKINASIALLGSLVSLLSLTTFAQNTELSEHIETITNAKPIERIEPKYPVDAARKGQEGWAKISFVIDKDGKVIDPIIQDSSGLKSIEKEALKAVSKWKYSPAMQDGEPIEQCQVEVQLDFRIFDKVGVTRKFKTIYNNITDAIAHKNYDEAEQLLAKLAESQMWNMTESSYFYFADSMYAREINDKQRELRSIERAVSAGHKAMNEDSFINLLERQFALYIDTTQYSSALKTFNKIVEQPNTEKQKTLYQPYADKLKTLILSSEPMIRKAIINADGMIFHSLSRESFSLASNSEKLDEVEVRCANKRSRFTASENSEWRIPEAWGQCTLFVTGSPDTQFNIIELGAYTGEI